jgi:ribosomal protein S18 acetylase RimI-like enzyme
VGLAKLGPPYKSGADPTRVNLMSFTIRTYRPDDLPRVCAITVAGFEGVSIDRNIEREFGPVGGRGWAERKAREVSFECAEQPDNVFVAEAGGAVVGYITTRLDHFTHIGRIPNLAVDAAHRGQGIASALIRHALDWMRTRGMALAKIETLAQNARGQSLYPKLGFQEVARQIHYVMPLSGDGGEARQEQVEP